MYYAEIREIDLQWNPQESIIYIPNRDSTYRAPLAISKKNGRHCSAFLMVLKSWVPQSVFRKDTIWALNLQEHHFSGKKMILLSPNNLLICISGHCWSKPFAFCTNAGLMYFIRTIPAEIFTESVQQSDDSIDNFLADTL